MDGHSERCLNLGLRQGLLFVNTTITHRGSSLRLENVLLDTGSAGTVFRVDRLLEIGVQNEPTDIVRRIYGVGGSELVYCKRLERVQAGDLIAHDFLVEIGAMEYGLDLDGILGLDFLVANRAVIDLETMTLSRH